MACPTNVCLSQLNNFLYEEVRRQRGQVHSPQPDQNEVSEDQISYYEVGGWKDRWPIFVPEVLTPRYIGT